MPRSDETLVLCTVHSRLGLWCLMPAILWQSDLLVEETGVAGENHRPATSHGQTLSHNVVSITPHHEFIHRSHIRCTYVLYIFCLLIVNPSAMKKWVGGGREGGYLVILYYLNATEIWHNKKGGLWWEGFYYKKGTIQPAI